MSWLWKESEVLRPALYHSLTADDAIVRPDMNMARLRRSAQRLSLADFDPQVHIPVFGFYRQADHFTVHRPWSFFTSIVLQEMLECLKAFVRQEDSWLPDKPGYSLYLRPFMVSHI